MPTTITTSTVASATGIGPGRRIDRCQNGILWAFFNDTATTWSPRYSSDNGATWTAATNQSGVTNASVFIDLDDYAHVAWKQSGTVGPNSATLVSGDVYYMRGTPNAGRTAWTWSAATIVTANTAYNYPDVVGFRDPATSGAWKAHIVVSYADAVPDNFVSHWKIDITSGGAFTISAATTIGGSYAVNVHTYPSIDFNHTGDGKTVAGATPHLYVGWNAGANGAGKGARFRKAVYSAGAWTWNAEREIDPNRGFISIAVPYVAWSNCLFDGTRASITSYAYNNATGNLDLKIFDRDEADTTTTTNGPYLASSSPTTQAINDGSATFDSAGNIYVFGTDASGANGTRKLNYYKWTRSGATLSALTTLDSTAPDRVYISAKRGSNGIEIIRTDKTATPWDVVYDSVVAPTPTTPYVPAVLL